MIQKLNEHFRQVYDMAAKFGGKAGHMSNHSYTVSFPSLWPNYIYGIDIKNGKVPDEAAKILQSHDYNGFRPSWIIDESTNPPEIYDILLDQGFKRFGTSLNMYLDKLQKYNIVNKDIIIRQIINQEYLLDIFCKIVCRVLFGVPDTFYANFKNVIKGFLGTGRTVLLVALYRGMYAGTAMLYITGDFCGIHHVAVIEEFQKKGLGSAMISSLIDRVYEMKLSQIFLRSSAEGEKLYGNFGFQPISEVKWLYPHK